MTEQQLDNYLSRLAYSIHKKHGDPMDYISPSLSHEDKLTVAKEFMARNEVVWCSKCQKWYDRITEMMNDKLCFDCYYGM